MFGSDYLNLILQEALPEKAAVNLSINTQAFELSGRGAIAPA